VERRQPGRVGGRWASRRRWRLQSDLLHTSKAPSSMSHAIFEVGVLPGKRTDRRVACQISPTSGLRSTRLPCLVIGLQDR